MTMKAVAEHAERYIRVGQYARAEQILRTRLRAVRSRHARPSAARLWNLLGVVHKYQGCFANAARAYSTAATLLRHDLPPDDVTFAALYHNLGGLEFSRGRYRAAERLARRGLAIRRKHVERGDPTMGADRAALAAILHGQKRYQAALRESLIARRMFRARRSARYHYDLAVLDNNIGAALQALGRYGESERYYLSSLRLKRTSLGPGHADVGISLNNLGELYRRMGRAREARVAHRGAVSILKRALGVRHPHTLAAVANSRRLPALDGLRSRPGGTRNAAGTRADGSRTFRNR
jgi:tetratricopeptide (TPR) repeat protein